MLLLLSLVSGGITGIIASYSSAYLAKKCAWNPVKEFLAGVVILVWLCTLSSIAEVVLAHFLGWKW